MASGSSTAQVAIDYSLATTIARLLSMFAEFPSTPAQVAEEAGIAARDISMKLPFVHGPHAASAPRHGHGPPPKPVTVERDLVVSCAGLLEMLAAMPSTPPDLRSQANSSAEQLWRRTGGS